MDKNAQVALTDKIRETRRAIWGTAGDNIATRLITAIVLANLIAVFIYQAVTQDETELTVSIGVFTVLALPITIWLISSALKNAYIAFVTEKYVMLNLVQDALAQPQLPAATDKA